MSLPRVRIYQVPAREATAELEVKRSRFRCRIARVTDEADARKVIAEERSTYGTARHHCSAFVLGPEGATVRSNDDGEPSGTAGPPMLEALRGAGLSDVVAVVSRWFGGTLLGTGGLVQAYGDTTRAALARCGSRTRELMDRLQIDLDYARLGSVEDQLRRAAGEVSVDYGGPRPRLLVAVAADRIEELTTMIMTSTSGAAVITAVEPVWVDHAPRSG